MRPTSALLAVLVCLLVTVLLTWGSHSPAAGKNEFKATGNSVPQVQEDVLSRVQPAPSSSPRLEVSSQSSPNAPERGQLLWVHVVDDEGWGVEAAQITWGEEAETLGHTDTAGHLRVELPTPGQRPPRPVLRARASGYVSASSMAGIDPTDATLLRASIQLQPAGLLSGRVLRPDQNPCAGAQVMLLDASSTGGAPGPKLIRSSRFQTSTDSTGHYSFEDLPLGPEWYVGSLGDSWSWTWVGPVSVQRGVAETAPDLVLPPIQGGRLIHGKVRWPDGRGVEGAVLSYRPVRGGAPKFLDADAQGAFATNEPVAPGEYEITAGPPERVAGIASATTVAKAGDEIVLVLGEHPVVELEVVDESSRPIANYRWMIGRPDRTSWGGVRSLSAGESSTPTGKTDLTWFPEISVVEVRAEGYEVHKQPVVPSASPMTSMRIVLKAALHISGRLEHVPEGVSEVLVSTIPTVPGSDIYEEQTWRLRGIRAKRVKSPWAFNIQVQGPGTYALRARAQGITDMYQHPIEVAPPSGSSQLVVSLSAGSLVHGRVWCSPETAPSFYRVSIGRDLESVHSSARVGTDHRYALQNIPPGFWWLRVVGPDGGTFGAPKNVLLEEGAVERADFDLLRPAPTQVRGRLRIAGLAFDEGIPSRGRTSARTVEADWRARLFAHVGTGQQMVDSKKVQSDGRFELATEHSGEMELRLDGDAGHQSLIELVWSRLPVDDLDSLDLDLIVGRVILRSSTLSPQELKQVQLRWTSPSTPDLSAVLHGRFASNGHLLFPNVPVGKLTIAGGGPLSQARDFTLAPGQDLTLDLD